MALGFGLSGSLFGVDEGGPVVSGTLSEPETLSKSSTGCCVPGLRAAAGIDLTEDATQAAARECYEEASLFIAHSAYRSHQGTFKTGAKYI